MDNPIKSRLRLINDIVSSDAGFEADCVDVDVFNDRKVSEREKILANLIHHIYRIAHPVFSGCQHPDWEEETEKELINLIKN